MSLLIKSPTPVTGVGGFDSDPVGRALRRTNVVVEATPLGPLTPPGIGFDALAPTTRARARSVPVPDSPLPADLNGAWVLDAVPARVRPVPRQVPTPETPFARAAVFVTETPPASPSRLRAVQPDQPLPAVIVATTPGVFDSTPPSRPLSRALPFQDTPLPPTVRTWVGIDLPALVRPTPRALQADQPLPAPLVGAIGFDGAPAPRTWARVSPVQPETPYARAPGFVIDAPLLPTVARVRTTQFDLPLPSVIPAPVGWLDLPSLSKLGLLRPPTPTEVVTSRPGVFVPESLAASVTRLRTVQVEPALPTVTLATTGGFDSTPPPTRALVRVPPFPETPYVSAPAWVDLLLPSPLRRPRPRAEADLPLPVVLVGVVGFDPAGPPTRALARLLPAQDTVLPPEPSRAWGFAEATPTVARPLRAPILPDTPWSRAPVWVDAAQASATSPRRSTPQADAPLPIVLVGAIGFDSYPTPTRFLPKLPPAQDTPLASTLHAWGFDSQAPVRISRPGTAPVEQPLPLVLVGAIGFESPAAYARPRLVSRPTLELPLTPLPTGAVLEQVNQAARRFVSRPVVELPWTPLPTGAVPDTQILPNKPARHPVPQATEVWRTVVIPEVPAALDEPLPVFTRRRAARVEEPEVWPPATKSVVITLEEARRAHTPAPAPLDTPVWASASVSVVLDELAAPARARTRPLDDVPVWASSTVAVVLDDALVSRAHARRSPTDEAVLVLAPALEPWVADEQARTVRVLSVPLPGFTPFAPLPVPPPPPPRPPIRAIQGFSGGGVGIPAWKIKRRVVIELERRAVVEPVLHTHEHLHLHKDETRIRQGEIMPEVSVPGPADITVVEKSDPLKKRYTIRFDDEENSVEENEKEIHLHKHEHVHLHEHVTIIETTPVIEASVVPVSIVIRKEPLSWWMKALLAVGAAALVMMAVNSGGPPPKTKRRRRRRKKR